MWRRLGELDIHLFKGGKEEGLSGPRGRLYWVGGVTCMVKVRLVKAMVSPVVMYGCESWTVKRLSAEELMLLNCGVGEDS